MTQGDGFDRLFGTGAPTQKPLGDAKAPEPKPKTSIVWTSVPGSPWLEQSNESPPKLRTKPYYQGQRS